MRTKIRQYLSRSEHLRGLVKSDLEKSATHTDDLKSLGKIGIVSF